jgi:hypothetical protein
MKKDSTAAPPVLLAHPADEPLVFYGPPDQLHGTLRLRNRTPEKVKLVAADLEARDLMGAAGEPLRDVPLPIRLYPGEQRESPVSIALDSRTPPGTYEARLTVGGQTHAAVFHVVQNLDLRVHPAVVTIYSDGQREFDSRFVAENAGNVPVRLGVRCMAPLVDSMEIRSTLRHGLARVSSDEDGDPLRSLASALEEQQVGLVEFVRPDVTLQPGEIHAGTATVILPGDLRSFRHYTADVELYNAKGLLDVYTCDLSAKKSRATGRAIKPTL